MGLSVSVGVGVMVGVKVGDGVLLGVRVAHIVPHPPGHPFFKGQ